MVTADALVPVTNTVSPATVIQGCYEQLMAQQSNVVRELLKNHDTPYQWDHYPPGDVHDRAHHSQYYYHSHPSHDKDRLPEHGHFHLFLRQPAFPKAATLVAASKKYQDSQGKKDNLCHLFGISMNEYGLPTALFTTNHWVVNGLWYGASDIIPVLNQFQITTVKPEYALTNTWVTHMVKLFMPYLPALLETRDQVMEEWQQQHPGIDVLQDRALEVTSILPLTHKQLTP